MTANIAVDPRVRSVRTGFFQSVESRYGAHRRQAAELEASRIHLALTKAAA
jgi:hypothetical protein